MVGIKRKSTLVIVASLLVLFSISLVVYSFNSEEMEVTALGDSLAYGLGNTSDNGYIGDVEKRYEDDLDKQLVVHDFGVPNDTSTDLLKRLSNPEIVDTAKKSDFILINIGTNDFLKSTNHLTKFNKEELAANEEIYKENLNQIIQKIQKKDNPKTIYILGIYNPKVKWSDMSDVNEAVLNWNRSTIEVTKKHKNTAFIRTDDLFINKKKQEYFSDKLHPNEKGYALIGKRVYETIKQSSNEK
ncbi:GDSL-type esterase/lipase family protein [Fictibacillus sp. b24]|uniref:GDSL-type esterase/lipase family protein n=1 Tax=Fictibacillus sp. b24 TaxID=3055863 RepID=UPI0025A09D91|nr:GDSL-type esterase/lipase family protein [Fictibacillus sp. b24]MDM5316231.1 GDSL-type esterase/lipase family protein [Fictibacillus sp. b24]